MDESLEKQIKPRLLNLRENLSEIIAGTKDPSHLVHLMNEVEEALNRLNSGEYGICEVCSEPIEEEYLRSDPLSRICFTHLTEEQQRTMERDLELAYHIQNKLLPQRQLSAPGWEFSSHYEPAGAVSGDFIDLIVPEKEGGDVFFILGDVSGKGISAALLMTHLNALFRTLFASDIPLNLLVERANRLFSESTLSTHFATLVCGRCCASGEIEICNAGHTTPFLIKSSGISSIESTGLPIGIFYSSQYEVKRLKLEPEETLFIYSDGLTEARDAAGNEFGESRLSSLLSGKNKSSPGDLIENLLGNLNAFRKNVPSADDLTMMVIKRKL